MEYLIELHQFCLVNIVLWYKIHIIKHYFFNHDNLLYDLLAKIVYDSSYYNLSF